MHPGESEDPLAPSYEGLCHAVLCGAAPQGSPWTPALFSRPLSPPGEENLYLYMNDHIRERSTMALWHPGISRVLMARPISWFVVT